LARLLESLTGTIPPLHAVLVIDNGGDAGTAEVLRRSWSVPLVHHVAGRNLGCGGGLAAGERMALERFSELTHCWILDDDAVVTPPALGKMLAALEHENADVAHALVLDGSGTLGWPPGMKNRAVQRLMKLRQTPAEFRTRCGADPLPLDWAQGIALLVTRRALDELGLHRDDYWVRGEDLEFSLRITHRFRGIYVPLAEVAHLPPAGSSGGSQKEEFLKHAAMLQNVAYTTARLPHGRRLLHTLLPNWLRFFRTWGVKPRVAIAAAGAFWKGAILGRPAGHR
jgi:GT2 family glycosyltransferase